MTSRRKKDNMTQGFQNLTEHFFNLPKLFHMKKIDSSDQIYLIYGKFEITSVLFFSRLDIIDMFFFVSIFTVIYLLNVKTS